MADADELFEELDRLAAQPAKNFQNKTEPVDREHLEENLQYVNEDAVFGYVYFDSRQGTNDDILLFKFVIPGNQHLAFFVVKGNNASILAFCHNDDSETVGNNLRQKLDQLTDIS